MKNLLFFLIFFLTSNSYGQKLIGQSTRNDKKYPHEYYFNIPEKDSINSSGEHMIYQINSYFPLNDIELMQIQEESDKGAKRSLKKCNDKKRYYISIQI